MSALPALRAALAEGRPAIFVRVDTARGSTPREVGAFMLVTVDDASGTVGGGALEMEAIVEARRLLAAGEARSDLAIPLGPAIGQCCGGHVGLGLRRLDAALLAEMEALEARERDAWPSVFLFGAGHTGQALAQALAPLPLRTIVVDTRADRLAALPAGPERRLRALPEAEIAGAPKGSAFVVMTHDHALDFLIAAEALRRADAAYVGMIGSATKRETFRRRLTEAGGGALAARLTLPIGGARVRDKRPAVIAALAAAEILTAILSTAEENRCSGFALVQNECNNPDG
ncbi:xanthine dehydrogenase accessory protein XdhC [Aureimonas sp. AU40]|uniref:xanthine dehydrogenase accessory protein XdhC n=1 Tax=Aureimonas sp. AU40 TaxID=1637747 RepID=UPI00078483AB|nr:xanthine dehydrogenase accessory protein XdhC [Aureimonas sp. AU40]